MSANLSTPQPSDRAGVASQPVVVRTRADLSLARAALDQGEVAVVMTMGALHEGHAALIRQARERARHCLLYTSPSPRDGLLSRMPSSA